MNLRIRPIRDNDMEAVVQLSLLAWTPFFRSFEQIMGAEIHAIVYPDWRKSQTEVVEKVCKAGEKTAVWVAEIDGIVVGFVAYELRQEDLTGEVQLLAVHPDYQNRGIGTELNNLALKKMKEGGMKLVTVSTGGDPSHAPARRSYEKAGYTPWPTVWYCKHL